MAEDQDPTPHSLVYRCAQVIYGASCSSQKAPPFGQVSVLERRRYFEMARAALAEAYREPVREPALV